MPRVFQAARAPWTFQPSHTRCVELLVERKADVNATNNYEDTPLHVAATVGHLAVARYTRAGIYTLHMELRVHICGVV